MKMEDIQIPGCMEQHISQLEDTNAIKKTSSLLIAVNDNTFETFSEQWCVQKVMYKSIIPELFIYRYMIQHDFMEGE